MDERQREDFDRKIDEGVKKAVALALEKHKRMGRSIVIWRDGKVVIVPPEEINPQLENQSDENR